MTGSEVVHPSPTGSREAADRPVRQEQGPAAAEIVEVAPDVLRMQLPIQFTGLGHVNMYGLVDRRGVAVVDPGMPGGRAWKAVVAALHRAGFRPRDVHTVVVTHSHPDHFGGANRLVEETGAAVVTHASFSVPWLRAGEPDVASLEDHLDDPAPELNGPSALMPWRAPGDTIRPPQLPRLPVPLQRWAWRLGRRFLQAPVPTRPLDDGEPIQLAGREWFAVHTPGHTADHLCLHDPESRVLLVGDHVLPTITPHISGIGCGADPLRQYLAALGKVAALDVGLVLPAHGGPFVDLVERTEAIALHHEQRLDQLRAFSAAEGPATVEAFTRALFPPKQWGLMAESEVFAHLEHLRLAGAARAWRRDRALVYAIDAGPGAA
jgi:glyoxylase-like metal-dependent hydrolase (beta-lactamase superfamily II)